MPEFDLRLWKSYLNLLAILAGCGLLIYLALSVLDVVQLSVFILGLVLGLVLDFALFLLYYEPPTRDNMIWRTLPFSGYLMLIRHLVKSR